MAPKTKTIKSVAMEANETNLKESNISDNGKTSENVKMEPNFKGFVESEAAEAINKQLNRSNDGKASQKKIFSIICF